MFKRPQIFIVSDCTIQPTLSTTLPMLSTLPTISAESPCIILLRSNILLTRIFDLTVKQYCCGQVFPCQVNHLNESHSLDTDTSPLIWWLEKSGAAVWVSKLVFSRIFTQRLLCIDDHWWHPLWTVNLKSQAGSATKVPIFTLIRTLFLQVPKWKFWRDVTITNWHFFGGPLKKHLV